MRLVRLVTLPLFAAAVLLGAPAAGTAQLAFGVHAPMATSIGGGDDLMGASFGVGGRVGLQLPLFPLAFWGTVDYMFPGGDDTSYQNFALDVDFSLPIPVLAPYVTGGYLARRFDDSVNSETRSAWTAGAGVRFNFVLSAYLEARREFVGGDDDALVGDDDQWLVRLGVTF